MGVDDILYTLFRHKWLILAFFCMGVMAACYVRITKPPSFVSHMKLKIHFLEEPAPPPGVDPANFIAIQPAMAGALNAEKETIKTLDLAKDVVRTIGARRVLLGKGDDLDLAAGTVCGSIDVDILPAAPVMVVSFRHKDKTIVQPALVALIDAYLRMHNEANNPENEFYSKQQAELRQKLEETQQALAAVLQTNKIVSLEETKKYYQEQRTHWLDNLRTAEVELAAKRAALSDGSQQAPGSTNSIAVPADVAEEYYGLLSDLANFKGQERQLVTINRYTGEHPAVLTVRGEIKKLNEAKAELLAKYPALTDFASRAGSTNSAAQSLAADYIAIRALTGTIAKEKELLGEIDQQLSQVLAIEPRVADLTSLRDLYATNLASFSKKLTEERFTRDLSNIGMIESPTPPEQDRKKLMKLLMMAFGGCVAAGLGLAFLIDFYLDRSLKRSVDIERHLHLPVFLSIPDTCWSNQIHLPWADAAKQVAAGSNGNGGGNGHALAHWDPVHHLQPYTDGLRERLLTYFEIKNQAQKRPKLVGLTACAQGAGVTTLASGLAASLSRVGNGNVLLVDMNEDEGVARSFHHGKPGCGLMETPEPDASARADAEPQNNFNLAVVKQHSSDEAVPLPVQGFNQLMPKLNASEYDYIVFDLPPVSQTSPTPRYSGYMDLVLLVVESEKTGQQPAAKASALMQESRAKVAAVLNKYRRHVPAVLAQDA
jgi:uncharacterized protein involved in exopolysaccharide biosynthesis/Mrp family chromosome partitioning ATPase